MISVQYPHFTAHPFDVMTDSPMHSGMSSTTRMAVQAPMAPYQDGGKPRHVSGAGVKKRPSRAGTRSVSTLTTAQLERKRANDREAQRAIRQRTKDHIEALERQIQELTSTNDAGAKLMQSMQRNKELEQENVLLRTRLNHAAAAMNENGLNSEHIMLSAVPGSPQRRIKMSSQMRNSTTPVPRSMPTSAAPSLGVQDQWGPAYSPVSTIMDRSPSMPDVSPVSASLRWGQQAQISPALSDSERALHPVDHNIQPPMTYSYVVDANGRPCQPVQPVSYQSDPQMMAGYGATSPGHSEYNNRHPGHSLPTPTHYGGFSAGQGYLPPTPQESDAHMHMLHQRHAIDSQPQVMYNMQQSMKAEH